MDADGPLARLKKAIFNAELYENIAEWIVVSVSEQEMLQLPPVQPQTIYQHNDINVFRYPLIYSLLSRHIGGRCC